MIRKSWKLFDRDIQDWYLVEKKCCFSSRQKITTERDCLIIAGISFQDLAPAYLMDLKPYCSVFFCVINSHFGPKCHGGGGGEEDDPCPSIDTLV